MPPNTIAIVFFVLAAIGCTQFSVREFGAESNGGQMGQPEDPTVASQQRSYRGMEWAGESPDVSLRKMSPPNGFIATQAELQKVWKAWLGDEQMPKFDFSQEIMLVALSTPKNSFGVVSDLDDEGHLTATTVSTLMNSRGLAFKLKVVSRVGVKTVNQQPLPGELAKEDLGVGLEFVGTPQAGTHLFFSRDNGATLIDIECRRGIDRIQVKRLSAAWPKQLLVRLHLSGLESFSVAAEDQTVVWAVSSSKPHRTRVSRLTGTEESSVGQASPYYSDVQILGEPKEIPLTNGDFQVRLPAALLQHNPESITLNWIDFYRN